MRAALVGLVLLLSGGCGAAQVTAYKATSLACHQAEQEIVDRPPTTLRNDQTAVALIRAACDLVLDRIEAELGQ